MDPSRFLLINPFGIGDVLFSTPLLRNIKLAVPGAFVGYIANRRAAPALEANPDVDRLMIYERDEVAVLSKPDFLRWGGEQMRLIRADRYDAVIDLSLNIHAGWLMALAGIRRRIGFDYKRRGRFLTDKVPLTGYEGRHVVEYYLSLLDHLGIPIRERNLRLPLSVEDQQWAREYLNRHNTKKAPVVAVFPGGGASWGRDARFKRWDAAHYAALADKIVEKFGAVIILMGNFSEQALIEEVAGRMNRPCLRAVGQNVRQTAALIAHCRLAVVNDGGPLHISVAAGTRVAAIFGPVDETVYGPYPPEGHTVISADIACRPCYRHFRRAQCGHIRCLQAITPGMVFASIEGIFQKEL